MLFLPNPGKAWQQPEQGEQEAPLAGEQTSLKPAQGEFSCSSWKEPRPPWIPDAPGLRGFNGSN